MWAFFMENPILTNDTRIRVVSMVQAQDAD